MKDFGKVSSRFWISDDVELLSDEAKLMALYLLTCRHSNMVGIYRLPLNYIAADLDWDVAKVSRTLSELTANNFLTYAERQKYVCIHKFMEHNPADNIAQMDARLRVLRSLPAAVVSALPAVVDVMQVTCVKASSIKPSKDTGGLIEDVRRLFGSCSEEVRPENKRNRELENRLKEYVQSDDRTTPRTGEVPSSVGSTTGTSESPTAVPENKPEKIAVPYAGEFEQWWQTFPKREGKKGYKQKTFSKYQKLIRQKLFTPEQLLANLQAYARYCDETKQTGTQYVMTTEPYLNNLDNLTNPWTVNYAARQRAGSQRSALDQVIEANREYLQPEPEFAETTGYDPQEGGSATKRQERDGYHPEAYRGAVYDHDGPVRCEVDEGARSGGSHGGMAEHPEGFRPETAGSGHQAVSAGEGLAAVSPGVSEAVSAETGGHRTAPDGEGMAGGQRRRRFAQSPPLEPSGGVSGGEGDGLA